MISFDVVDYGTYNITKGIDNYYFCDDKGNPSPIKVDLAAGEFLDVVLMSDTNITLNLNNPFGIKETIVKFIKKNSGGIWLITGADFCKMEEDDDFTVYFKDMENHLDPCVNSAEFDVVEGVKFVLEDGTDLTIAMFSDEQIELQWKGDGCFVIEVSTPKAEDTEIGGKEYDLRSAYTVTVNRPEILDTFMKDIPVDSGLWTSVSMEVYSGEEIVLGDENQLDAILSTMAEMEEIQEQNDGTVIEEDPEAVEAVNKIFKPSDLLNTLDKSQLSLLSPGEIEKIEALSETLVLQIAEATKAFNKRVLKAQLPKAKQLEMMRELNGKIKPMKAQLEVLKPLLPELKKIRALLEKNEAEAK